MFDFIYGWTKASQCKRLMKKVRCRLNVLKNKRCCIVRQLRNDVSLLIKHGHYQTAFHRVDQIYKDECIIAVYDLLAHFCEFLSIQLFYIRRNKDCPNDINEAISSLIFASARCGDLPELLRIRKLFRNRYGEHFEARALGLLPGNLVNFKIRENLSITKVPNEVKYKLMEELTTSVLQGAETLALEYTPQQETKGGDDYGVRNDQIMEKTSFPDEIKEFQSPFMDEENGKDQRVFLFTSTVLVSGSDAENDGFQGTQLVANRLIGKMGSRAMSMPCTRLNKCEEDEDGAITRSYSFPVHVHPKLPDYDDLAAKFMALKKQNLQKYKL